MVLTCFQCPVVRVGCVHVEFAVVCIRWTHALHFKSSELVRRKSENRGKGAWKVETTRGGVRTLSPERGPTQRLPGWQDLK